RFAVITSSVGTDARYEVHVIDLARRKKHGWAARKLVEGFENDWRLVEGMGTRLWFVTNWQAPRGRLVAIDLGDREPEWKEIIGEGRDIVERASVIGRHLVVTYLHDASTRAIVYSLAGSSVRELSLNGIGSAAGFEGRPG